MCKKWTIFSTQHIELYKFGAGWLFGKKIDPAFRRDVTKEILNLRVTDKMRELVEKTMNGKDQRCAALNGEIEAEIVALPLGLLVGPCLLILGLVLYMNRARRAENSSPAQLAASGNDFFNSFSGERGIQDSNSISWQRQLELIDAVVKKRR